MNGWVLLKMLGQAYERSNEETASSPLTTLLMARASSAGRVLIAHVCKEDSGALDTKEVRQKRFAPVSRMRRWSSCLRSCARRTAADRWCRSPSRRAQD